MVLNTKGYKRMLLGEEMPDKNNPKYKERYEREVEMGRQFAEKSGLSRLFVKIQLWAQNNKKTFLITVFGFVIFFFILNIITMVKVYRKNTTTQQSVEQVHKAMEQRRHITDRYE
ncbi:hypothetical protein [uncultured Prevotella sp.]|uniref:hypothetical protein n=1 Tax=uncultured Prevotella sp. TaxID=159272 RepID=UPI002805A239|nr:hypothetical protein [uncultured Prevotella sp.]